MTPPLFWRHRMSSARDIWQKLKSKDGFWIILGPFNLCALSKSMVMCWGSIKSYLSLNKWQPFSVILGQICFCVDVSILYEQLCSNLAYSPRLPISLTLLIRVVGQMLCPSANMVWVSFFLYTHCSSPHSSSTQPHSPFPEPKTRNSKNLGILAQDFQSLWCQQLWFVFRCGCDGMRGGCGTLRVVPNSFYRHDLSMQP